MRNLLTVFCLACVSLAAISARAGVTFPYPTPANHLRVVTWNLEFFNDRSAKTSGAEPNRTSAQLDVLAQRIKGFDASVIALEEIDQISALDDLRSRMGGSWQVYTGSVLGQPQQNAVLYDASKVDLISSAYVYTNPRPNPNPNNIPSLYPEWSYRSPVTAVFSPVGHSNEKFRVIGIHGHYNDATARNTEGYWLSNYVHSLLTKADETDKVILMGDFNGVPGSAPHNGLIYDGDLSMVAKSNGNVTAINDANIDHIYVTAEARSRLTTPTAFVVKPEYYGETWAQFEGPYSDHSPVFVDYAYAIPDPRP